MISSLDCQELNIYSCQAQFWDDLLVFFVSTINVQGLEPLKHRGRASGQIAVQDDINRFLFN